LVFASSIQFGHSQGTNRPTDYSIKIWTTKEGLPSSYLSHITKDKHGYLWISTYDGAARFDGSQFKIFDTKNISDLSTSSIKSILALPDCSLYFSTQSSGLLHYVNGVFTSPYKDSILPKSILLTEIDDQGVLWVATEFSGLFNIVNGEVKKYDIPEFNNVVIKYIKIDSKNDLWVATQGAGVARITKSGYELFTVENGLIPSNQVYSVLENGNKTYLGTDIGLAIIENGNSTEDNRFKNVNVNYMLLDKRDNMWLGTSEGLIKINKFDELENISSDDGKPIKSINGIESDDNGNIWVSTYREDGLILVKASIFKNLTAKTRLSHNNVNIVSEAADGRVFVGNHAGGVDILEDENTSKLTLTKIDSNLLEIKDILVEEDSTLWIATYAGLIKKTRHEEIVLTKSNGLLSNNIRRLTKAKDGSIWVASRHGGVNIIDKNNSIKSITVNDGLKSNFVFSIDQAPNGDMILGTSNGGMSIVHPNMDIEVLYPDTALTSMAIFNVYVENNNRMWLATNVGLYCYTNSSFYLIDTNSGFPVEAIFDVIEDENENFWITSRQGLVRIEKQEALQFIEGNIENVKTTLYDDSDGMITRECTAATRMLLATDGRIWVPTIEGITIVNPNNLKPIEQNNESVFIENVIIDDHQLDKYSGGHLDSEIYIEPGHRNYEITFTSLSLSTSNKLKFKYKLEEFDDRWVDVGNQRHAKYTNLPYGNYTFKVKVTDENGVLSEKETTLELIVVPFFYEMKSFYVSVIFVFLILIYVLYKFNVKAISIRNKELVKLNQELDSFAYSVSHDLKAPLSSIKGLLNIARLDDAKNANTYFNKIEKSVSKLDAFIKDIIDYSKNVRLEVKKDKVKILNLIEETVEWLAYLKEEHSIKTIIEAQNDLIITIDKTRFVFILNNLVANAYRYADLTKTDPFVKIEAFESDRVFTVVVSDNGQGIKKEYLDKIFNMFYRANEKSIGSGLGLYIVKESTSKLGGDILVNSEHEIGSTFTLRFPLA